MQERSCGQQSQKYLLIIVCPLKKKFVDFGVQDSVAIINLRTTEVEGTHSLQTQKKEICPQFWMNTRETENFKCLLLEYFNLESTLPTF